MVFKGSRLWLGWAHGHPQCCSPLRAGCLRGAATGRGALWAPAGRLVPRQGFPGLLGPAVCPGVPPKGCVPARGGGWESACLLTEAESTRPASHGLAAEKCSQEGQGGKNGDRNSVTAGWAVPSPPHEPSLMNPRDPTQRREGPTPSCAASTAGRTQTHLLTTALS